MRRFGGWGGWGSESNDPRGALQVNITRHELVPRHHVLSDEEKKTLLRRYHLQARPAPSPPGPAPGAAGRRRLPAPLTDCPPALPLGRRSIFLASRGATPLRATTASTAARCPSPFAPPLRTHLPCQPQEARAGTCVACVFLDARQLHGRRPTRFDTLCASAVLQVVKIVRPSETAGWYVTYRLVT